MTLEQATEYIRKNQKALNLTYLARFISLDVSNLRKAINGKINNKGTLISIPQRCLPALEKYFEEMKIRL